MRAGRTISGVLRGFNTLPVVFFERLLIDSSLSMVCGNLIAEWAVGMAFSAPGRQTAALRNGGSQRQAARALAAQLAR